MLVAAKKVDVSAIEHVNVRLCLAAIARNPRLKFTDLLKIGGMSRRGLDKAFVAETGVNPGKMLRQARLQCGCELLVTTRLHLGQIASRCGYRNANGLCVAFRRDLKMTPNEFRRRFGLSASSMTTLADLPSSMLTSPKRPAA
ncbi:MAG: AraC family transcriptional regulator [Verrucomicrobiota bacterium]